MTIEKTIEQLEDLKRDREGFAKTDESNGVFAKDIKAIDIAVKALQENKELKRLLKLAVDDFDFIYEEHSCTGMIECRKDCTYCDDAADCCKGEWKHADEAMKLKGE